MSGSLIQQKPEKVSDYYRCFTCGSCDVECPINIRTGKLFPRSLVRLAVLGFYDDLVREKSIWYCIQCGRCIRACPMTVKPAEVILMARRKALSQELVETDLADNIKKLRDRLQNARFIVASNIFSGEKNYDTEYVWELAAGSVNCSESPNNGYFLSGERFNVISKASSYLDVETSLTSCWTCGACTNACPVSVSSEMFSPMMIIRQTNIGDKDGLLKSAKIWLCIECEKCIDACPQAVKGLWVIKALRDWMFKEKPDIKSRYPEWIEADVALHKRFIEAVNTLLDAVE